MKKFFAGVLLVGSVVSMSGCSGKVNVSQDDQQNAAKVLCLSSDLLISELKVNNFAARSAAKIIAENTTDKNIKNIAQKVASGKGTDAEIAKLQKYVKKTCK